MLPEAFLQLQGLNVRLYSQGLYVACWLTASPPALFPVSGDALRFRWCLKIFSTVLQENEEEPVCLQSLSASGIMLENLFCFSTSSPFCLGALRCLLVCRNRYKVDGVWWCGKAEHQNHQERVVCHDLVSCYMCVCALFGKWDIETLEFETHLHKVTIKSTHHRN